MTGKSKNIMYAQAIKAAKAIRNTTDFQLRSHILVGKAMSICRKEASKHSRSERGMWTIPDEAMELFLEALKYYPADKAFCELMWDWAETLKDKEAL